MQPLKVLSTISKLLESADEVENSIADAKMEKTVELIKNLRQELKNLKSTIEESRKIPLSERRVIIHKIVQELELEGKQNGFNDAQTYYTDKFLSSLKDPELAIDIARALVALYPDKHCKEWTSFITNHSLVG